MTRYGMVIDLTRCGGCYTCVVACQQHHNQRPGVAWAKVDTLEWGAWPDGDRAYFPHACMHCDDAPCVAVCPTGASVKRDDGIVTIDYEACIGCGACIEACPYDARTIVTDDSWFFGASSPAPYEAEGIQRLNVAEKCQFCHERVDEGEQPYCVAACPTVARIFGDVDDPKSDISAYIAENGAENVPGTAIWYVMGQHDFDPQEMLLVPGASASSGSASTSASAASGSASASGASASGSASSSKGGEAK